MDRNESVWHDPLGSFYARKYCIASRCNDDGVWVVVGWIECAIKSSYTDNCIAPLNAATITPSLPDIPPHESVRVICKTCCMLPLGWIPERRGGGGVNYNLCFWMDARHNGEPWDVRSIKMNILIIPVCILHSQQAKNGVSLECLNSSHHDRIIIWSFSTWLPSTYWSDTN